jgi:hypothetical protein
MDAPRINRASGLGLLALALTALAMVCVGFIGRAVLLGYIPPPDPDEGTAAHLFQLSIAGLVPVGALFLATADWTQPWRAVRRLFVPGAAVVLAFAVLYYFETYYPAHH